MSVWTKAHLRTMSEYGSPVWDNGLAYTPLTAQHLCSEFQRHFKLNVPHTVFPPNPPLLLYTFSQLVALPSSPSPKLEIWRRVSFLSFLLHIQSAAKFYQHNFLNKS